MKGTLDQTFDTEAELVNACHQTVVEMRDTWHKAIHGERIAQRRADKAGQDIGSPDYLLTVNGWNHPLEFKRGKGGRFSLGQMVAAERRRAAGVMTYAPSRLLQFDALIAWSERHRDGICFDCPVVPIPEEIS
jgi:hypothetical protein